MEIPNLEKMNVFLTISIGSLILIGLSTIYRNEKFIDLWFVTFIYAAVSMLIDVGLEKLKREEELRWFFLYSILIIYILIALFVRSKIK